MKILISLSLSICFFTMRAQDIPVYDSFDTFEKEILKPSETGDIHVVNFWATWCKPCVQEMPYFEELHRSGKEKGISVSLVSLDFPRQIETKLLPFIDENEITAPVVVLDDGNTNVWIDKVDPSWSGALPVTIIFKNDTRKAYERTFHSLEELMNEIESL